MVVHYLVKPANWCKFLASWGWYAVTSYCSSGECWGHLSALRYGSVYPSHSTWKLKWLEKDSPFRIRFHVNLGECTIFGPWIVIHKVILPHSATKVFGESWSSTLGDLDGILHGSGAWSLWCQVDDGKMQGGGGVPLEACNQHIPWRFGSWGWGCGTTILWSTGGVQRQQACKVCVMAVGAWQDTKDVCVAHFVVQTMAAV